MTTITTPIGNIPSPSNWAIVNEDMYQTIVEDTSITIIEKQSGRTTVEDIADALDEYERLYKAGFASDAEVLTLSRAYPDNTELAHILIKFFNQTLSERMQQSIQVRKNTIERYTWDKTAKVWEDYIDSYTPTNEQGKWNNPPTITNIPDTIPPNLSNVDFIKWIFNDVVQIPDKLHTWEGTQLHRTLTLGAEIGHGILNPMDREKVFAGYKQVAHNNNSLESLRTGHSSQSLPKFLIDAYQRYQRVST